MTPTPRNRTAVWTLGAVLAAASLHAVSCGPRWKLVHFPKAGKAAVETNKICLQCHIDFEDEILVTVHRKRGVTCVRCHGPSQPHMDDEVRATLADATFKGKTQRVFCLTCHWSAGEVKIRAHAAEAARRRACTTCHGEHRIERMPPPTAATQLSRRAG